MTVDKCLLYGMQGTGSVLEALDGDERLAIDGRQQTNARVDGAPRKPAISGDLAEHDRARTAVAFGAAFLRAGATEVLAQKLKHGRLRRNVTHTDDFAVEKKTQFAAG